MRTILVALSLAACSSGPPDDGTAAMLHDYAELVDAARTRVSTLVEDVAATGAHDDVRSLLLAYRTDMFASFEDLGHMLEDMDGCRMDDDGMHRHEAAGSTLEAMRAAVDGLRTAHDAHAEHADCEPAARDHGDGMERDLSELAGHHDPWMHGMRCGAMGGHGH